MTINEEVLEQVTLDPNQIEEFYIDIFAEHQVRHFEQLTKFLDAEEINLVADIGGGCGYFARELNSKTGLRVRVLDTDQESIETCLAANNPNVEARIGDALDPKSMNDEDIITFNLILHHLVGRDENETRILQKKAIMAWRGNAKYLFINEYIYDSLVYYVSGRIIFEITKSKFLSNICRFISKIIPSFRANTFGVGVRFRAHNEWVELFEECGFEVVDKVFSEVESTALPLRMLLIRSVRRDSFLLKSTHG